MPQPFDYTLQGVPDPSEAVARGLQIGQAFAARNDQRALQQAKIQEAQQAQAQQAAMSADLAALAGDPSVQNVIRTMAKYPELGSKYKELLGAVTDQKKQSWIKQVNNVYAPLLSGRKDLALKNAEIQLEAAKNAGDEQAVKATEMFKNLIESEETGATGDNAALMGMGAFLSEAMGADNFAKTYEGIGKERRAEAEFPANLSKAQAEAKIKENEARGIMPPKFLETETGIMAWDTEKGQLVPTGFKPSKAGGVNISLGTPQFAVEEATGQQVIYQPSPTGEAKIIRGLRPVTEQTKESGKEVAKFNKLANVIDIAKKTLEKASGSYAGAIGAGAQRAVGVSSETTKANAKMRALQAAMMMNMPRMEGPQSDKDVQLYREQAGQIGDPTIPIEDRLAALDVLSEIMDRYKSVNPTMPKGQSKDQAKGAASVDELMKLLGK